MREIKKKITRKEKRTKEEEINFFVEFIKIKNHFFKDIINKFKKVKDPRHQGYIEYGTEILLLSILMKNVFCIESMNEMTDKFNKDECIENMAKILGYESLEELPRYDTINDFLTKLKTSEIEDIRDYMIKELLKKRSLEGYRILDKYWGIAIDGTELYSFKEKHCEHCLKREFKDKVTGEIKQTLYHHAVLEAKLVIGTMVFSIATEFIENEDVNVTKQDCEINAFKRLAPKIKKKYPQLPICILADSLYTCEPVFDICKNNNWKYLLRFKEGRIKTVAKEFRTLSKYDGEHEDNCIWVNGIDYKDTSINIIEVETDAACVDDKSPKTDIEKNEIYSKFLFITNITITLRNADRIAQAGRSRWRIENEGFNDQKNNKYKIKHANSMNYNAMKNHYLITQIADILRQLFEKGFEKIRSLNQSIKKISMLLLESFRTRMITEEDILSTQRRTQARFL